MRIQAALNTNSDRSIGSDERHRLVECAYKKVSEYCKSLKLDGAQASFTGMDMLNVDINACGVGNVRVAKLQFDVVYVNPTGQSKMPVVVTYANGRYAVDDPNDDSMVDTTNKALTTFNTGKDADTLTRTELIDDIGLFFRTHRDKAMTYFKENLDPEQFDEVVASALDQLEKPSLEDMAVDLGIAKSGTRKMSDRTDISPNGDESIVHNQLTAMNKTAAGFKGGPWGNPVFPGAPLSAPRMAEEVLRVAQKTRQDIQTVFNGMMKMNSSMSSDDVEEVIDEIANLGFDVSAPKGREALPFTMPVELSEPHNQHLGNPTDKKYEDSIKDFNIVEIDTAGVDGKSKKIKTSQYHADTSEMGSCPECGNDMEEIPGGGPHWAKMECVSCGYHEDRERSQYDSPAMHRDFDTDTQLGIRSDEEFRGDGHISIPQSGFFSGARNMDKFARLVKVEAKKHYCRHMNEDGSFEGGFDGHVAHLMSCGVGKTGHKKRLSREAAQNMCAGIYDSDDNDDPSPGRRTAQDDNKYDDIHADQRHEDQLEGHATRDMDGDVSNGYMIKSDHSHDGEEAWFDFIDAETGKLLTDCYGDAECQRVKNRYDSDGWHEVSGDTGMRTAQTDGELSDVLSTPTGDAVNHSTSSSINVDGSSSGKTRFTDKLLANRNRSNSLKDALKMTLKDVGVGPHEAGPTADQIMNEMNSNKDEAGLEDSDPFGRDHQKSITTLGKPMGDHDSRWGLPANTQMALAEDRAAQLRYIGDLEGAYMKAYNDLGADYRGSSDDHIVQDLASTITTIKNAGEDGKRYIAMLESMARRMGGSSYDRWVRAYDIANGVSSRLASHATNEAARILSIVEDKKKRRVEDLKSKEQKTNDFDTQMGRQPGAGNLPWETSGPSVGGTSGIPSQDPMPFSASAMRTASQEIVDRTEEILIDDFNYSKYDIQDGQFDENDYIAARSQAEAEVEYEQRVARRQV